MTRAASVLSAVLLLVVLAGAAGIWIGIPYLERRWTYRPVIPEKPWDLPEGADKVYFTTADGVRLGGWFLERRIDPRSIALIGGSLGAPIVANLAADSPCRGVALISTFASARHQARIDRPWLPQFVLDNLGSPLDTVGAIDEARCPVLVVHGANDKVVPLAQAREVYDAAPRPKRLIVVPGARHGFEGANRSIYLEGMMSFFLNAK